MQSGDPLGGLEAGQPCRDRRPRPPQWFWGIGFVEGADGKGLWELGLP